MALPHRVVQLDALRLDEELHSLFLSLSNELSRSCNISMASVKPEIHLFLRLVAFMNTANLNASTPGLSLHNLRFSCTAAKVVPLTATHKLRYVCAHVLFPYIVKRLSSVVPTFSERVQLVCNIGELLNRLHFLRFGRFPSLAHRLAEMALVHAEPVTPQRSPFEIVHSQLVWQGVAQFALFLAPVIRALVNRPVRASRRADACAVCAGNTMLHAMMPCGCLYCYHCGMQVRRRCDACGGVAGGLQRLRFD
ncbi:unnamed protein product [Agarophyton chilense]